MKKNIIAIAAVVAAFTVASCSREQLIETENSANSIEGNCIITASTESTLTKTALNGSDSEGYNVVWSSGDKITIGDNEFTLIAGENTTKGTFQGDLPAEDGTYTACYPATYNGEDWPASQTYTANNITGSPMTASVTVSGGEVTEKSLSFTNKGGILRLTVKGSENILVQSITVSAKDLEDITLNCSSGVALDDTDGTVFHIAMPYGEYSQTSILISSKDGKCCVKSLSSKDLVIERSKITRASFTANDFKKLAPEGALSGIFTVSEEGKKVYFSKGNLYWDGNDYQFEDNQYNYNVENHVSSFYWTNSANLATGSGWSLDPNGSSAFFTNADENTANPNFTANGQKGLWRTLSKDEWNYLINRDNGIGKASIDNVTGIIIFCDGYTGPTDGLTSIPEGCVFLPVNESLVWYWSSTCIQEDLPAAEALRYENGAWPPSILPTPIAGSENKNHVRLVTDYIDNPSFTVSFDMNGHGTAPANITGVQYRSTITKPSVALSADGLVFVGWYKDKGCKTEWYFGSDVVTANTTLYAGWVELPEGAIPSLFTIDANGKRVFFSQGNLYYGSRDYELINGGYVNEGFHFETYQCVSVPGKDNYGQGILSRDKYHISHLYWTTTYYYDGNTPYNENFGEYKYTETDVLFTNRKILNINGQTAWRALTKEECEYLFNQRRIMDNSRVGYENYCCGISVLGSTFNGIFLYPDDYNGPLMGTDGAPQRWSEISAAGIVFLPAAGYRDGKNVRNVGYNGYYFLNTPTPESVIYSTYQSYAYALTFNSESVNISYRPRNYGSSIRLVMELSGSPTPTYTVTFNANGHGTAPAELKKVLYGSTITKPADLNVAGYDFLGWYTDKNCTNKWDFDSDIVDANITLYAGWFKWPDGALSGKFTVADGKQVHFSQGNLYYDGANWGFESKQYYFRTYSGKGKCDINGYDDDGTANGHWGLFGWSTSTTTYGMNTSSDNSTYSGSFVDWGKAIDDKDTWRTLSKDEWVYLFQGREGAANKFGYATIWGKNGLIILPDEFTDPMKNGGSNAFVTGATTSFTSNTYSVENWAAMESAGAIFLPFAGYRGGGSVYGDIEDYGNYWSSTNDGDQKAYYLSIGKTGIKTAVSDGRHFGLAVRLVTDVK